MINQLVKIQLLVVLFINALAWSESTSDVSIVLSSADENVTARSTVLLVCVAYGSPAPDINWRYSGEFGSSSIHNGTSIRHTVYNMPSDPPNQINFTESILEICSIGIEEGGQYSCHASNSVGEASNASTLTVLESGEPTRPCHCSSVPVYNKGGALTFIEFNWTKVENPPVLISGVNPNITEYNVYVDGLGLHLVPAESVCPAESGLCSYLYPAPSFRLPQGTLVGHVAARNEIGTGKKCTPSQNNFSITNSYMTISLQTTDDNSIEVECLQGQASLSNSTQSFACEFCYISTNGSACHRSGTTDWTCNLLDNRAVSVSALNKGMYCYRVTAFMDGSPTAVVQDSFNIRQRVDTVTNTVFHEASQPTVLTITLSVLTVFTFVVGLTIGCLVCLCCIRTLRKPPQRVCLNCTGTNVMASASNEKGATCYDHDHSDYYESIPLPSVQQQQAVGETDGGKILVDQNDAYGKLPEPMW